MICDIFVDSNTKGQCQDWKQRNIFISVHTYGWFLAVQKFGWILAVQKLWATFSSAQIWAIFRSAKILVIFLCFCLPIDLKDAVSQKAYSHCATVFKILVIFISSKIGEIFRSAKFGWFLAVQKLGWFLSVCKKLGGFLAVRWENTETHLSIYSD